MTTRTATCAAWGFPAPNSFETLELRTRERGGGRRRRRKLSRYFYDSIAKKNSIDHVSTNLPNCTAKTKGDSEDC